jgi:hypothetical protein
LKIPTFIILALLWTNPTLAAQLKPAEKPLLSQATRLFTIKGVDTDRIVEDPWLSNWELLQVQSDGTLGAFNILTRHTSPLTALSNRVDYWDTYIDTLNAAPAGRWVWWGDGGISNVCSEDGTRHYGVNDGNSVAEPFWCADGNRWISFVMAGHPLKYVSARIHTLSGGQTTDIVPALPSGLRQLDVLAAVSVNRVIARTPDPLIYHHVRRVAQWAFAIRSIRQARRDQCISVWSLHRRHPIHQWTVHLPQTVSQVIPSPRGDRIAWLLCPTLAEVAKYGGKCRTEVWISDIDGAHQRPLGHFDAQILPSQLDPSHPEWLKATPHLLGPGGFTWSPDESRLSFEYKNALWSIPVNP